MCSEQCSIMSWGERVVFCDQTPPLSCLKCCHAYQYFSIQEITSCPFVDSVDYPKDDQTTFKADVHFSDDCITRHYQIHNGVWSLLNPKTE